MNSHLIETYNGISDANGLRPIRTIEGKRKNQVDARIREHGLDGFMEMLDKVSASAFLCGGGERGWKADFDWLIGTSNMQKVLEGKYDDDQRNTPLALEPSWQHAGDWAFPHARSWQSGRQKSGNERRDPFLERAVAAYAAAQRTAV